jgi:hypothetical protein
MIEFVAYFSTAQDELGYVVLDGYGSADTELSGGTPLASGTYRVQDGVLMHVEADSATGVVTS